MFIYFKKFLKEWRCEDTELTEMVEYSDQQ